jgi:hypothetical protein
MHELILKKPTVSGPQSLDMAALAAEFEWLDKEPGRIYQTYVFGDRHTHTFMTTSKDVHLGLGRLSRSGQLRLAKLLEAEMLNNETSQLRLRLDNDGKNGTLLVVMTTNDDGCRVFTLSPAR